MLLLLFCASPRANHALRTLPPSEAAPYARGHDQAVWEALQQGLGEVAQADAAHAWSLASVPAIHGGLGLQSAERTAPAAYWAAWMGTLPVIRSRLPQSAASKLSSKEIGGPASCLREAAAARNRQLGPLPHVAHRLRWRPPTTPTDAGPGDWPHDWQHHATRTRNLYCRDRVLLPSLQPASRALSALATRATWSGLAGSSAQRASTHTGSKPCSSHCGDDCACPCPCGPTAAGTMPLPANKRTNRTGLPARRARIVERAWVPDGPTGKLFPNSIPAVASTHHGTGSAVRRPPAARPRRVRSGATAGCDVLRRKPASLPSPGQGNKKRAPRTLTAPRSGSPSVANTRFTKNSARAGRSSSSRWVRRSKATGTPKTNASCATCFESGRNEPRRPCARRRERAGLIVGGAC